MILGITAQNHDASMALIDGDKILWAGHSERYSRKKNDTMLDVNMVREMREYGEPTQIVWFEKPWSKNLRRLYSGQRPWIVNPQDQLKLVGLDNLPMEVVGHHHSHAAAGYYTSGYSDAAVLVVDAIGEWDTVSIWEGRANKLKCKWRQRYPNSIGLFYTAFTDYVGLKPNEEEYILMGMAAYGSVDLVLKNHIKNEFFEYIEAPDFKLRHNLHRGCRWWTAPLNTNKFDIAACVQSIVEDYLIETVIGMSMNIKSKNLVFMGGVALNCVANARLARSQVFDNIWIMPNPGDAGSAIGAVAVHIKEHLTWKHPYLGTDIKRELDIDAVVKRLQAGEVVAVANGRAEFGPRALGNRSLLCDPRGPEAKSRMNAIKKREQFRPFAPAVLKEHAGAYFDMPVASSPYMQFVAKCTSSELPGVCHVDGTSRVQTVSKDDNITFRTLLEEWNRKSGCPVLMNTSLNIKGEPLVNTWDDALKFQNLHNIPVY